MGSEEDLRWLPALTAATPVLSTVAESPVVKGDTLWCTELTLKCDGYVETEQNLMDEQAAAPDYADCSCEDVSIDANFDNFGPPMWHEHISLTAICRVARTVAGGVARGGRAHRAT